MPTREHTKIEGGRGLFAAQASTQQQERLHIVEKDKIERRRTNSSSIEDREQSKETGKGDGQTISAARTVASRRSTENAIRTVMIQFHTFLKQLNLIPPQGNSDLSNIYMAHE